MRLRISQPRDADHLGQPVEHAVHRELRLVGAEAAERAAHQVVGARGDGLDVDAGTWYGPVA